MSGREQRRGLRMGDWDNTADDVYNVLLTR
jgi:hypothetical protein